MSGEVAEPSLDLLLPARVRDLIEQSYYARVNSTLTLEEVAKDPTFLANPLGHLALYTDHGVIHMRDVASRIIPLIGNVAGVKIGGRTPPRLAFMQSYGCLIASVHDIGMSDLNPFGRSVHAEFAAHEAFGANFDEIIDIIWEENVGNLAWRVLRLTSAGVFDGPPRRILRELLALAYAHSKSAVPVAQLNDVGALREAMIYVLSQPLGAVYHEKRLKKSLSDDDRARHHAAHQEATSAAALAAHHAQLLGRHYTSFEDTAYAWLEADDPAAREFVGDVVDTIRCLRCADALRQRGTDLRTSGSYQIFIDQRTANAVYALHDGSGRTFLLEADNALNAGEANLAVAEVTLEGDLRFAFFRGRFGSDEAMRRAAHNASLVVDDIQADVVESFLGVDDARRTTVLIEHTEDNPDFAPLVAELVAKRGRGLAIQCVPTLLGAPELERRHFMAAHTVDWDAAQRTAFLAGVATRGYRTDHIDVERGFQNTRLGRLGRDQVLTEVGARATFVYIPLTTGLRGRPSGGYDLFAVQPFEPMGVTGVIRGDVRNATVFAEDDVEVLIIPKDVFLRHWHRNYTPAEFSELLRTMWQPEA